MSLSLPCRRPGQPSSRRRGWRGRPGDGAWGCGRWGASICECSTRWCGGAREGRASSHVVEEHDHRRKSRQHALFISSMASFTLPRPCSLVKLPSGAIRKAFNPITHLHLLLTRISGQYVCCPSTTPQPVVQSSRIGFLMGQSAEGAVYLEYLARCCRAMMGLLRSHLRVRYG